MGTHFLPCAAKGQAEYKANRNRNLCFLLALPFAKEDYAEWRVLLSCLIFKTGTLMYPCMDILYFPGRKFASPKDQSKMKVLLFPMCAPRTPEMVCSWVKQQVLPSEV